MDHLNLPPGVTVIGTDTIPEGNADHGGEQAVHLQTASGAKAWGFGETVGLAAAEALAALADDF